MMKLTKKSTRSKSVLGVSPQNAGTCDEGVKIMIHATGVNFYTVYELIMTPDEAIQLANSLTRMAGIKINQTVED